MGHMAERWSLYKMQSCKMCCASCLSAPHSHLAVSPTLKQLNIWQRSLLWPHLSLKIDEVMTAPITIDELDANLKELKTKKAPGPDNVPNDLLINLGPQAKRKLLGIFNTSWKTGTLPGIWKRAVLIPIQKKGQVKRQGRQLQAHWSHQLHLQIDGKNHQSETNVVLRRQQADNESCDLVR